MNKPRREMSTRRIAKSVRTHEKTMAALGASSKDKGVSSNVTVFKPPYDQEKDK